VKSQSKNKLERFSRQVVGIMPLLLREFVKREDNDLSRGKISFPQMVALDYVDQKGPIKMTELAKVLSIQMSSATVLADRLIRAKLLCRKRDEKDRRLVWASVTPKGRKVISQIMAQKRRSVKEIFKSLTDEERSQYLGVLVKVQSHLLKGYE